MRVTDEMVLAGAREVCARWSAACGVDPEDNWKIYSDEHKAEARAILTAALSHAAGQDGEQCRAASGLDESEQRSLEQRAAAWDAVVATCLNIDRNALASYGPNGRESIVAFIRALSRGVPEGMVLVPMEPTQAMLDAFCNLEPDKITEFHYYGGLTGYDHFTTEEGAKLVWSTMLAAIAAQRKEGPDA